MGKLHPSLSNFHDTIEPRHLLKQYHWDVRNQEMTTGTRLSNPHGSLNNQGMTTEQGYQTDAALWYLHGCAWSIIKIKGGTRYSCSWLQIRAVLKDDFFLFKWDDLPWYMSKVSSKFHDTILSRHSKVKNTIEMWETNRWQLEQGSQTHTALWYHYSCYMDASEASSKLKAKWEIWSWGRLPAAHRTTFFF